MELFLVQRRAPQSVWLGDDECIAALDFRLLFSYFDDTIDGFGVGSDSLFRVVLSLYTYLPQNITFCVTMSTSV